MLKKLIPVVGVLCLFMAHRAISAEVAPPTSLQSRSAVRGSVAPALKEAGMTLHPSISGIAEPAPLLAAAATVPEPRMVLMLAAAALAVFAIARRNRLE